MATLANKGLLLATLIGAVGICLWATETVLVTFTTGLPTLEIVALAFATASLLSPLAWKIGGGSPLDAFRQPLSVWLVTVPCLVLYHACIYYAVHRVPATPAALLHGATPLFIVLGSALLPGERLRWWHLAGAGLGAIGMVWLVDAGRGDFAVSRGLCPVPGVHRPGGRAVGRLFPGVEAVRRRAVLRNGDLLRRRCPHGRHRPLGVRKLGYAEPRSDRRHRGARASPHGARPLLLGLRREARRYPGSGRDVLRRTPDRCVPGGGSRPGTAALVHGPGGPAHHRRVHPGGGKSLGKISEQRPGRRQPRRSARAAAGSADPVPV